MSKNAKATIKIESDTSEANKGIQNISKQLDAMSNSIKKSPVEQLAGSFNTFSMAAGHAMKAVKAVSAAVNDLTAKIRSCCQ